MKTMSTNQLTAEAMALPLAEKAFLARALWASIDSDQIDASERAYVREAVSRDRELSTGAVGGINHKEAMSIARRAVGCK